jgi:hypothetical protein
MKVSKHHRGKLKLQIGIPSPKRKFGRVDIKTDVFSLSISFSMFTPREEQNIVLDNRTDNLEDKT